MVRKICAQGLRERSGGSILYKTSLKQIFCRSHTKPRPFLGCLREDFRRIPAKVWVGSCGRTSRPRSLKEPLRVGSTLYKRISGKTSARCFCFYRIAAQDHLKDLLARLAPAIAGLELLVGLAKRARRILEGSARDLLKGSCPRATIYAGDTQGLGPHVSTWFRSHRDTWPLQPILVSQEHVVRLPRNPAPKLHSRRLLHKHARANLARGRSF